MTLTPRPIEKGGKLVDRLYARMTRGPPNLPSQAAVMHPERPYDSHDQVG